MIFNIVETKDQKDISEENVKQKQKSALDWVKKVNQLKTEDRMKSTWHYVILGDKTFKDMKNRGASAKDMFIYCELTNSKIEWTLL